MPREFIDGCSCVPYGVVAVRREVSAGHVLNRLLVAVKARIDQRYDQKPWVLLQSSHSVSLENIKITHYTCCLTISFFQFFIPSEFTKLSASKILVYV